MKRENRLVKLLAESKIYSDYERAFSQVTGLTLWLGPATRGELPPTAQGTEPNCKNTSFDAISVPVKIGEHLLGFLHAGRAFEKKPAESLFNKVSELTEQWGLQIPETELKKAWLRSRILSPQEHDAVTKLLEIFALHLSELSNQIAVQQENAESPMITRAKEYILQNQQRNLSLGEVAKVVNASSFYLCRMFKKSTGLSFTEYICRVRIETAKDLLLNPNLRIREVSFQVGFQSVAHFNRVFKKVAGESPTAYREKLLIVGRDTRSSINALSGNKCRNMPQDSCSSARHECHISAAIFNNEAEGQKNKAARP